MRYSKSMPAFQISPSFLTMIATACFVISGSLLAQDHSQESESSEKYRDGSSILVPLPIDSTVSDRVKQKLKGIADRAPIAVRPDERPLVVLEFDTSGGRTGRGSELEACQSLARFLAGSELNRLQTVAFVPPSRGGVTDEEGNELQSQLNGHAVLVAISANQLVLAEGTSIGRAGIDEQNVDPLVRAVYENIANQRLTLPVPVVASMLEQDRQLFRVNSNKKGVVYVDGEELQKLEASGEADQTKTISRPDELTFLTSEQLSEFGLTRLTPSSKRDLESLLNLSPNSLERNLTDGKNWNAIRIKLPGMIDSSTAKWSVRALRNQTGMLGSDLVIVEFDECDGSFNGCMRLAQQLAEYDPNSVRTVAFVKNSAVGPAAVLALTCDHLVMSPSATLGGRRVEDDSQRELTRNEVEEYKSVVVELAERKQTDWSMMLSMLDPSLVVTRYQNRKTRQTRLLSNEEFASLEDRDDWASMGPVGGLMGVNASAAEKALLVRTIATDMAEVESFYQLESPTRSLQATPTDRWIEDVAHFLSSPFVAPWLLFAGFFFFSTEMSAPGMGLPGFLATVCFVLFFWSQFLGGNAEWVEIILFVLGGVFIAMEIFVLPGFGIFGIGGLLMVIVSLVLASQAFIIPMTSAEVRQLPYSLMPVLGAGLGMIAAVFALKNILPNSPYLKRLMLDPERRVDTGLLDSDPEAVVDWSHLNGKKGVTTTRLFPAGKARIAGKVYDVISKGQMIDKGQEIVVLEAVGNRVVVACDEQ